MTVRTMRIDEPMPRNEPVEAAQPLDPSAIYRRLQKPAHNRISWKAAAPAVLVVLAGGALIYGVVQSGHQASTSPAAPTQVATSSAPAATPAPAAVQSTTPQAATPQPATPQPATKVSTPAVAPAQHRLAPRTATHVARSADRTPAASAANSSSDASATLPNDTAPTVAQPQAMTPAPTAPSPQAMTPSPATVTPSAPAASAPDTSTAPAPTVSGPVNPPTTDQAPTSTPTPQ